MQGIEFFVPGQPRPAGSKVSGVAHRKDPETGQQVPVRDERGRLKTFTKDDTGEAGMAWRADVRAAAAEAMGERGLLVGAVGVRIDFLMPRLKAHWTTGGLLKPGAPTWHIVRPDIDKLSRAVLDALKGIVWNDDGQVVQKHVVKRYTDPGCAPGAFVRVGAANASTLHAEPVAEREQLRLT